MRSSLFAVPVLLLACLACSSSSSPPASNPVDGGTAIPDTAVTPTETGGETGGIAEPTDDPTPDLPEMKAYDGMADQPVDLSCVGKPFPVKVGEPTERDFITVSLGGSETDRVADIDVELFTSNVLGGAPDIKAKSSAGPGGADTASGNFKAKVSPGYLAYHLPAKPGFLELTVLDLTVRPEGLLKIGTAPEDKVNVIAALMGGPDYKVGKGNGRFIIAARDCKNYKVSGLHVSVYLDDVAAKVITSGTGVRRNYFGDNELPSTSKNTTRSGVIAFTDIPPGKKVRIVARGRAAAGAAPIIFGVRPIAIVPDGLATSQIYPWTAP